MDIENYRDNEIIAPISNYTQSKKYNENKRNKSRHWGLNNHSQINCPTQGKNVIYKERRITLKKYVAQKHLTNIDHQLH